MGVETVPVEELMSTELLTISPDAKAETAAETLLDQNVGSLIVLDQDGEIGGVLTSTDLIEIVSAGRTSTDSSVSDHMTTGVVTIGATDSVHDAAVTMIREGVQHLPVTGAENDIVGLISATDITAQMMYMGSSGTD